MIGKATPQATDNHSPTLKSMVNLKIDLQLF